MAIYDTKYNPWAKTNQYVLDIVSGALRISDNWEITQPLQPSFLVFRSAADSNVTGDGTVFTCTFDSEIFDQGGDFASNTFTAPVTGRYFLSANICIEGCLAGHTTAEIRINTSNRRWSNFFDPIGAKTDYTFQISTLADMDANDTAVIQIVVSGSTKVVDIPGHATLMLVTFSGSLIN